MRYIFYSFNDVGVLTLHYVGDETEKRNKYVFYTLRQAISKFRKDNNLSNKHIRIVNLNQGETANEE